ncbi:alpha/beta hydrolase-like protein [Phyllosticta citriasiana]|uniref:alpha/beta hydrolase-like protein n=1 Tax=Phyllosticta citriasiana TaxID=595635 RepID=UPI0030FD5773
MSVPLPYPPRVIKLPAALSGKANFLVHREIEAHPEFPHITWNLKPEQMGKVAVAATRGGTFNIAYELHGHGPSHIVWIMGLGGLKSAWQRQTKDFAHVQADKYSSLIIDNRGIGESDRPLMRYSTSEMAKDVLEVVDFLKWTGKRELHVVGVSMGGMIAQELAYMIPDRICSLSLVSTASQIFRTKGIIENFMSRFNMLMPRSLDAQIAYVKGNLYTQAWLAAPDATEAVVKPFPTNGDRFAAGEIKKRSNPAHFNVVGFTAQMIACGWHHKSAAQLWELAERVGHDRIMVLHGTEDKIIPFEHFGVLIDGLEGVPEDNSKSQDKEALRKKEVEKHVVKGQGHVLPIEMRKEFNSWIAANIEKGEQLNQRQTAE